VCGPEPRDVCNFIAGMTDRYFLRLYDTLFA
jgi:dGTP triphosphohydrolase